MKTLKPQMEIRQYFGRGRKKHTILVSCTTPTPWGDHTSWQDFDIIDDTSRSTNRFELKRRIQRAAMRWFEASLFSFLSSKMRERRMQVARLRITSRNRST